MFNCGLPFWGFFSTFMPIAGGNIKIFNIMINQTKYDYWMFHCIYVTVEMEQFGTIFWHFYTHIRW